MWRYLAQRLLFSLVTLFLVASFVFVIVRVIPGDPAQVMLGDQASQEALVALRSKLGLDQPILVQYATSSPMWRAANGASPWSPDARCSAS